MPEPSPAKTNISMEMNSATAALMASGWVASAVDPTAILAIGILVRKYVYIDIFMTWY